MSDTKDEREVPLTKDHHDHEHEHIGEPTPPLFLPTTSPFSTFDYEGRKSIKRPRYTTSAPPPVHQWKQQSPMGLHSTDLSPMQSNPQAQLTSPDTSSSPSLSPIPSSSSAQENANAKQEQQQFRKGKYVSPVWKPHEMLWLAKAWRVQYQGDGAGTGVESATTLGGQGGRGKTRAEKDREVAEFLNRQGVQRDAKTAGTKWDNMLGEFRKVYEWERGGEREQIGKSYFRLSPYERKIHRLPASFDEEVFEELSQFMGPRMRPTSSVVHHHNQGLRSFNTSSDLCLKALPPPPPCREDDFPLSSVLPARARQTEPYFMCNPRNSLLGYEPHHPLLDVGVSPLSSSSSMMGSRVELRRIGRMKLTWEESVSLWAEEGEYHRGRVKVEGCSLLNADELTYFDESMVASTLETFDNGPFKGFSVDRFVPGQQLKVFGRRKPFSCPSAPLPSTGYNERFPSLVADSHAKWEFQDPTDYFLGCLRVPTVTLPSLVELSWYVQEPPPEEFRLPLRKDIYRDLPHGRELFFTTSSNEPLDCKSFTIDVLSSIIRSNPSISASTSTSRDSYIALWDDCINRVIAKFCPFEMIFTRKHPKPQSSSESLQDQLPNLMGMVKNLCLWRGEETDQIRESQPSDPSSTITKKISWTYNNLPYVLGYHAVGHNVTFCALSPSTSPSASQHSQITRTDLYSIDLSNPSERLKSMVPCWRIGILLASLADRCSKNCHSDFGRQDLGDGNIVEMTPNKVTKFYSNKKRWQKVKEIYDMLDQRVPHVELMTCYNENELTLVFKPRGIKAKPKNCQQLVLALKQVTKALVALHDLSFMHRDLSWDKVMLRKLPSSNNIKKEEEEWFVAGFEEAASAPQINPMAVAAAGEGDGRHAPEMGRGVHGVKVDVWGIGYLVKTSGVKITKAEEGVVGKQLRELEGRCMEQNPEQRPTAADCYHHLLQIQSSLSSASATAARC